MQRETPGDDRSGSRDRVLAAPATSTSPPCGGLWLPLGGPRRERWRSPACGSALFCPRGPGGPCPAFALASPADRQSPPLNSHHRPIFHARLCLITKNPIVILRGPQLAASH